MAVGEINKITDTFNEKSKWNREIRELLNIYLSWAIWQIVGVNMKKFEASQILWGLEGIVLNRLVLKMY